ncbi:universal stress protein [Rhabdothermincola sediminis]|uniref:universal stress protein n=1 Tax=Rhabdothermincola sediminis TaxID=2751370 RepID=UPI001AA01393|nr:universal stress protein [Rhabdothermincola sediminis]
MYANVIVPFDGTLPARAVLAPAGDLAWHCDARVVIVNNTEASDKASKAALKSRAMSMSGSDVDFWVDLDHDLGRALIEAARHRADPIIAIPIRTKPGGLRRRPVMAAMPAQVLLESPVPVLVIGPKTDVTRGLPMTELVVALDGSPESEQVLPVAVQWARELKLDLILVGVVRAGGGGAGGHEGERRYLEERVAAVGAEVPRTSFELLEAPDPATGLCRFLADHEDAVIAMSTHGRSGLDDHPLGSVAQGVLLESPRAMLFVRPTR